MHKKYFLLKLSIPKSLSFVSKTLNKHFRCCRLDLTDYYKNIGEFGG